MAKAVLTDFTPVKEITVCIRKPEAPIKADFEYVAVEITRTAEDYRGITE